jgi:hypothetical protein
MRAFQLPDGESRKGIREAGSQPDFFAFFILVERLREGFDSQQITVETGLHFLPKRLFGRCD